MSAVEISTRDGVGFIAIANPPVNGLNHTVRAGLVDGLAQLIAHDTVEGIVLHGVGTSFCAGGDIKEFGTPAAHADPGLSAHVHPAIEASPKTIVAAIHGYALGGGFETALACHRRVAVRDAMIGLPEARIGAVPLSGTQRLPRLVGMERALDMILTGCAYEAALFHRDVFDAITDDQDDLLDIAAALSRRPPPPLVRDLPIPAHAAEALARARSAASAHPPITPYLLDALAACIEAPNFDAGLAIARRLHDEAIASEAGKAARADFFAARTARKSKPGGAARGRH